MHMEMEYRLTGNLTIILNKIISITSENFGLMCDYFLGKFRSFTENLFIDFINICIMLLRQN